MSKQRLKSPRGRLFVALDLPGDVRGAIAAWQAAELTDPALRAVPAENLHMTLVFLGWQAERDFERIAATALGFGPGAAPAAPEVELLGEPARRPPRGRPRLLAIEARSPQAERLQGEISGRLERARFHKSEKRPFWTHVTVARVRPERKGSRRPAAVETMPRPLPEHLFASFRPTRLVVFRSHLHPSGARYEPMAELELPTA